MKTTTEKSCTPEACRQQQACSALAKLQQRSCAKTGKRLWAVIVWTGRHWEVCRFNDGETKLIYAKKSDAVKRVEEINANREKITFNEVEVSMPRLLPQNAEASRGATE